MKKTLTLLLAALTVAACSPIRQGDTGAGETPPPTRSTGDDSTSPDLAVTPGPPGVPLQPPAGEIGPQGWLPFTSLQLAVSLEYPPDWQAVEGPAGVTFTSPDGAVILLERDPSSEPAGLDCTALVNSYSQEAAICPPDASGRYSTAFTLALVDGSVGRFMLSTADTGALETYRSMIDTLHPAP